MADLWSCGTDYFFVVLTACFLPLSFVFFCPQEQPGLYAHEAVTDEGEQVYLGSEQLPF